MGQFSQSQGLAERDVQHVWHPGAPQHGSSGPFSLPFEVVSAAGCEIVLADGKRLIDGISSWWCKSLGHQHPRLKKAMAQQLACFEHVIAANTTNAPIVLLSEKLAGMTKTLKKAFYAGDGSCAVEAAMKMSLHVRKNQGDMKRTRFIALERAYHGETVGAMSVSDLGLYRRPYQDMLFDAVFLSGVPYVASIEEPLWSDCALLWPKIAAQLAPYAETATAVVVEPVLQGAGGMRPYAQDFLRRLRAWASEHNVHVIADEIMTGLGRTGRPFACMHAGIEPDVMCLSKGLTSGWLPFSVVLVRDDIYECFCGDKAGQPFLHSHTYSGHVLGACLALEALAIMAEERLDERAMALGKTMWAKMQAIAEETGQLANVRGIGAVVAADMADAQSARAMCQRAIAHGALLRPLGNTIYWLPPLTIEWEKVAALAEMTRRAINR